MKRILLIMMLAMAFMAKAEETDSLGLVGRLQANPNVTVIQPQKLADKLIPQRVAPATDDDGEAAVPTGGYRIQAYSGNNPRTSKGDAQSRAEAISTEFPQWATYVTFAAPYWRLKVGDFRSYEEAHAALSMLKKQFPDFAREMRLVRDKIKAE